MGVPAGLAAALPLLSCPHCTDPLRLDGQVVGCTTGHRFDVARNGQLNLLSTAARTQADTVAMVAARQRFLASGHYATLRDAVAQAAAGCTRIVETGAGTGYYIAGVLGTGESNLGVATDLSVPAARRAAKAHPRLASLVADTWGRLPLLDAAFDAVLSIFAPRNPAEFARVLTSGGKLIVALPTSRHLLTLRTQLQLLAVEPDKHRHLATQTAPWFDVTAEQLIEYPLRLHQNDLADLIAMGPNAFHTRPEALQIPDELATECSVNVLTLTRRD